MIKNKQIPVFGMLIVALMVFGLALRQHQNSEEASYSYLSEELNNAKLYTLAVLEAMPAEGYAYQPTEDVRTFGAQAYHIAYSLEWYNARFSGSAINWQPGDENRMDKAALLTYTSEQFDRFIAQVEHADETGELTRGILSALRHTAHHQGQTIIYLREKGIDAPQYQ